MTSRRPLTAEPPVSFEPDVLHFKGILKNIEDVDEDQPARGTLAARKVRAVKFNFTDVEVIESKNPFPFPVFMLRVNYSQANDQPWSVFAESFRKVAPEGNLDIYELEGKQQEWAWDTCNLSRNVDGEWKVVEAKAWQVVSVEGWANSGGDAGPGIDELILDLANGKDANGFMQAYYQSNDIRGKQGYAQATEKLAKGRLLPDLVTEGKLSVDAEGIYSKVE